MSGVDILYFPFGSITQIQHHRAIRNHHEIIQHTRMKNKMNENLTWSLPAALPDPPCASNKKDVAIYDPLQDPATISSSVLTLQLLILISLKVGPGKSQKKARKTRER